MFGLSQEHKRFNLTGKCPRCGRFIFARFTKPNGQAISPLTVLPLMDRGAIANCRKCGGQWRVFGETDPPTQETPIESHRSATVTLIDSGRTLEPIGDEVRTIDNARSDVQSVRRIKATRRWLRRCEVGWEQSESRISGINVDPGLLVTLKHEVENAVRRSHSASDEQEDTFEEEIEITVPGRTAVQVTLSWKRIWQEGLAVCTAPSGQVIQLPYRLVAGVTFDQRITDVIA